MKLTRVLALLALGASAGAAQAEVSGTVTAISDYDFRGISQTSRGPALQGSLDWSGESGLYLGAWGSNVDFGDCCDENIEIDVYGGFRGGENITYDVGAIYYAYPGADSIDYPEIYAALGWKWLTGKIWYSWDFGNTDEDALYYEANAAIPFGESNFAASLHVGYSDGGYWDEVNDGGYTDWSVGVTYALSHFTFGVKWVDGTDLDDLDDLCDALGNCAGIDRDVFSTDGRFLVSISTTFPWSKE